VRVVGAESRKQPRESRQKGGTDSTQFFGSVFLETTGRGEPLWRPLDGDDEHSDRDDRNERSDHDRHERSPHRPTHSRTISLADHLRS
jgi:hypothetical protein